MRKRIAIFMTLLLLLFCGGIIGNISYIPTDLPTEAQAVTVGQENALASAKSYLRSSAFSKKGLKKQLKYEKYKTSEINYAIKHCGANWNTQAKKSAKSYLRSSAFSKSGLIKQLKYEGFTSSQANYGVKHCGANWKKQAVRMAKSYLKHSSFSRDELLEQLLYEGFTKSQAEYAVAQTYD